MFKKICIIQPILTSYRLPVFIEMAKHCYLTVVYSASSNIGQGFGNLLQISEIKEIQWIEVPTLSLLGEKVGMYQRGIISLLQKIRPDAIVLFSNLRYLSFWTTLLWCNTHNLPVFLHGHGLCKKSKVGIFWKLTYRVVLKLSSSYICYTSSVAESLMNCGLPSNKIVIAENSLVNSYPVLPDEKDGSENGILFIGRLRPGCGLDYLIKVIDRLHRAGQQEINLHIIGNGVEYDNFYQMCKNMPWVHFYGECYNEKKISEISRKCRVGCYPGNAGLSVVHMFSLSLPPITHNNMMVQGPPVSG